MIRRPYSPRMTVGDRRTQLLDAALDIIDRDGYRAVSIDAIAREADVTRPVVYRVFDDLPTLLGALLDRQEARALGRLSEVVLAGGEPMEILENLIEAVRGDAQTWRPILLAGDSTPARVRTRIDRDRGLVRAQLETLIGARAARLGVDPPTAAHALIAIAEHFGRLLVEDPDNFDAQPVLDSVRAILEQVR